LQAGHNGVTLSPAETAELAQWLDSLAGAPPSPGPAPTEPTEPGPGSCAACHGLPPSGTSFPDTGGAHAAHAALPGVGADCSVCHLGAAHDGFVDLAFPTRFDARSGPATHNLDGTCSSVSCHGGETTPEWWTGTIVVEAQCRSCHQSGTSEYNGYFSGRHARHIDREGLDCTVCHSTAGLAGIHFAGLGTPEPEGVAAATIGGTGTRVTAYNPTNGTCTTSCHGSERW
ncbi:MAG: CxxxxCH/CxxCH domain-containing protein, partial [Deferrisomatales bacterium]|nr:CxxxxCH/CxxCH domain-containing protein [Deferrisomatales bacterium]